MMEGLCRGDGGLYGLLKDCVGGVGVEVTEGFCRGYAGIV